MIDLKKLLKENNEIIKSLGPKYKNSYNKKTIKKYQKFKDINVPIMQFQGWELSLFIDF